MISLPDFQAKCQDFATKNPEAVILAPASAEDPLYAMWREWARERAYFKSSVEYWILATIERCAGIWRSRNDAPAFAQWFARFAQEKGDDALNDALPLLFSDEYDFLPDQAIHAVTDAFKKHHVSQMKHGVGMLHPFRTVLDGKRGYNKKPGIEAIHECLMAGLEQLHRRPDSHSDVVDMRNATHNHWAELERGRVWPNHLKILFESAFFQHIKERDARSSAETARQSHAASAKPINKPKPSNPKAAAPIGLTDADSRLDATLSEIKKMKLQHYDEFAFERLGWAISTERQCRALDPQRDWREYVKHAESRLIDIQHAIDYAASPDANEHVSKATPVQELSVVANKLEAVLKLAKDERERLERERETAERALEAAIEAVYKRCRRIVLVFNGLFGADVDPEAVFNGDPEAAMAQPSPKAGLKLTSRDCADLHSLDNEHNWFDLGQMDSPEERADALSSVNLLVWHQLCHALAGEELDRALEFAAQNAGTGTDDENLSRQAHELVYDALAMHFGATFYAHQKPGAGLAKTPAERKDLMFEALEAWARRVARIDDQPGDPYCPRSDLGLRILAMLEFHDLKLDRSITDKLRTERYPAKEARKRFGLLKAAYVRAIKIDLSKTAYRPPA